ncbi:Ig-like domain-containing protein [Psychroserpens sp. S379A]|uniref:Ig-like domain-containing protein n=1 Tax=Psychroserpens sp. S379A TaxID=3415137 RepID=UPI003C7E95D7
MKKTTFHLPFIRANFFGELFAKGLKTFIVLTLCLFVTESYSQTPPVFLNGSPTVTNYENNTLSIDFEIDKGNTVAVAVLTAGSPTPLFFEVLIASPGFPVGVVSSEYIDGLSAGSYTAYISGLSDNTTYDVYLTTWCGVTNQCFGDVTSIIGVNTGAIVPTDSTAPVFENATPLVTGITASELTLTTDIDEEGTIYYVVLPDESTLPSSTEVKNGTGSGGAMAILNNSVTVSSDPFSYDFNISGLDEATAYDIYVVAQDNQTVPNLQASPTLVNFTTLDITSPAAILTSDTLDDPNNVNSVTISVDFSENVMGFDLTDFSATNSTLSALTTVNDSTYTLITSPISDGIVSLQLPSSTVTDSSGNANTASNTLTWVYDGTAPLGYDVDIVQSPINIENDDAVGFTFSGAEVGTTYNYIFTSDGGAGTVTGSGTILTATGEVSLIDISSLPDGIITLNFTLTDTAGNEGAAAIDSETKDTIAPTAPSTPDLDTSSDTCDSDTDDITTVTTPTFNGSSEVNATINLISNIEGNIGTTVADGSGNWSIVASDLSLGLHIITATATDSAGNTSTESSPLSITITELDDASFSYSASTYCVNEADPTPTVTGLTGGTFSTTSGLSLNPASGAIDVSTSTPGTYTVSYTTVGTCSNSSDVVVTINALDDASFSYSASTYCVNEADPTPTVTGLTGGTFSTTSGLSLNPASGTIDVSASTPGTYTVSYTTVGTCSNSSDVVVTINALDDASFSYSASTYCVNEADPTPTVTGLTGGTFSTTSGLSLNPASGAIDVSTSIPGTYTVSYTTVGTCSNSSDVVVTINALDDASFSYSASTYCVNEADPTPTVTGLTGGTFSTTSGLSLNPASGAIDVSASTPGTYTVSYTTVGTCSNSSDVVVTINALDDASFGYNSSTYVQTGVDPMPVITGLTGGSFIASPAGLSIDPSSGLIDVSLSTPGTYTITYTTSGVCSNSFDVVVVIESTLSLNDNKTFAENLSIYPNPAENVLFVNNTSNVAIDTVKIYDLQGRLVKFVTFAKLENGINLQDLESASYFMVLTSKENKTVIKRFIKK